MGRSHAGWSGVLRVRSHPRRYLFNSTLPRIEPARQGLPLAPRSSLSPLSIWPDPGWQLCGSLAYKSLDAAFFLVGAAAGAWLCWFVLELVSAAHSAWCVWCQNCEWCVVVRNDA